MASIGQQITAARKAKGMTQEALSQALNISRAAVSQWERDRRMPDAETLLKLSAILNYSFTGETATAPENAPPEAEQAHNAPGGDAPKAEDVGSSRNAGAVHKKRWIILCSAAVFLLCAALVIVPALKRKKAPAVFSADDGTLYTIEQFQQETPREDGKAWLLGEKGVKIITNDGNDVWMYEFTFHEMNGVGLTIDRLEVCTFYNDKVLPMIVSGESLPAYGMEADIPPRGEWKMTGGLPVSDNVKGAGITLYCTDEGGSISSFSDYLALHIAE